MPNTTKIRELNDTFRKTLQGGQVLVTSGVGGLPTEKQGEIFHAVRTFTAFGEDNDPHDEHDFGWIIVDGEDYFFKIDYYDKEVRYGSEDPSDPKQTTRVMTIMQASEY